MVSKIPVISLATTVILVVSAVVLVISLNEGVEVTTRMLLKMDRFTSKMLQPIEMKGVIYSILTVFALCVGVSALVVDFVNSSSRFRDIRSGQFCEGTVPCLMMILVLFVTLLAWIWALTEAIKARFAFEIQDKQCHKIKTPSPGNNVCISPEQFFKFAVPKDYTFINHCHARFVMYCVEYIVFGEKFFNTVAVCAVLVCMCLVNYMMAMASHFAYFNRQPSNLIGRQVSSSSRSLNRPSRSRSRSQNWHTRSESEEFYSPPPKGANSSAANNDNSPKVTIRVRNVE